MQKTFYIDGEWNGWGGELISLAMTSFYDELYLTTESLPENIHPWVLDNVVPMMDKISIKNHYSINTRGFGRFISSFLDPYKHVHIVADWPEDIARFCDCLIVGPGVRVPLPKLTFEIVPLDGNLDSEFPHNALSDARAIRDMVNR